MFSNLVDQFSHRLRNEDLEEMPISKISEKEFFTLIENIIKPEKNEKAISFLNSLHKVNGYDEKAKRDLLAHPYLATKAKCGEYKIKIPKAVIENGYIKQFDIQLSRRSYFLKNLFNSTNNIINPILSILKENSSTKGFSWKSGIFDGIPAKYFSNEEKDSYLDEVDFIYFLYNEKVSYGQAGLSSNSATPDYLRDYIIFRYNYPYYFTNK